MIAIIDSGSTKADWTITDGRKTSGIHSQGMNPNTMDEDHVASILSGVAGQLGGIKLKEIYFYGAGCSGRLQKELIRRAFERVFPGVRIHVAIDSMAAVMASCGNEPGIVCILGTGCNSVYFNGRDIEPNNYGLGYILSDEGAGTDLGKILITHYLYGLLPENLAADFSARYNLNREEVINRVYKNPSANAWLASFASFYSDHRNDSWVTKTVTERIGRFVELFVMSYPAIKDVPVHFIGSIAFIYSDILKEISERKKFRIGQIIQKPIDRLVEVLVK